MSQSLVTRRKRGNSESNDLQAYSKAAQREGLAALRSRFPRQPDGELEARMARLDRPKERAFDVIVPGAADVELLAESLPEEAADAFAWAFNEEAARDGNKVRAIVVGPTRSQTTHLTAIAKAEKHLAAAMIAFLANDHDEGIEEASRATEALERLYEWLGEESPTRRPR